MTLILTLATASYVLQVSDRLVTKAGEEFDPLSNKNVIYEARDAIVSIGYSGLAYIGSGPTDQWIAEKLRDELFTMAFTIAATRAPREFDIGQATALLSQEFAAEFSRRAIGTPVQQLVIAGWQWRKRTARPIMTCISNTRESPADFEKIQLPRYWHYETDPSDRRTKRHQLRLTAIGRFDLLSMENVNELMRRLGDVWQKPDLCEELLVHGIRAVANRSDGTVGSDCMSILIPAPASHWVRVRYIPVTPGQATFELNNQKVTVPAAFSPWVVGRQFVFRPSVVVGGMTASTGAFAVSIEAPPVPPAPGRRILSALFHQRRHGEPT